MRRGPCILAAAALPLALALPAGAAADGQAAPRCGDFLAQTHRKPPHAVFAGCQLAPDEQGKPLRASYQVDGRFAAETERFLGKAIGLAPLQHSCCQWDGPARTFRDRSGRRFTLAMVSDETIVHRRADWPRIPHFAITVELLTEEI